MDPVKISFVIGQLGDVEMEMLNEKQTIISKMILSQEDFALFRYKHGDSIQVETEHGNRLWCIIKHLEMVEKDNGMILIFTLTKADENRK